MRVPLFWLHEYVRPDLDTHALADRLALTGTEVERVERHGVGALQNFVVGRVLKAEQHPNADRLRVCVVDIGDGSPSQIVCGAPNVAAGQTVAVARPGAVMPDGTKLGKAKLRGLESNGMILAEDEVAIGTDHDGIMVLERDGLAPGTPLEHVLPIATDVLVLEITPNRPDCLGIYGVAREVHAATGASLSPAPWKDDPGSSGREPEGITVTVQDPDLCPRFTARVFEDVKIGPSPLWLKARLMAAGQRPISNVVDITNYVMLLTAQPLHAFDLDRVAGARLTVRRARDGEQIETLDGQTRTLDSDMVLIEDAEGPTSIAGVMGGARREVQPSTTRVLMEAANWNGANIHHTSLKLGLRSEASSRFEKQLQPEQAMEAQAVSTQLMIELCGARLVPGTIDVGGEGPPPKTIRLSDARVASLLGAAIPRSRCREILAALEFGGPGCGGRARRDRAGVPPRRRDPRGRPDRGGRADRRARQAAGDAPFSSRSARPAHPAPEAAPPRHRCPHRPGAARDRRLELRRARRERSAPAARDHAPGGRARRTQYPASSRAAHDVARSLLDVARHNRSRGAGTLRLFEAGAVYCRRAPDGSSRASLTTSGPCSAALPARRHGVTPRPVPSTSSRSRACWPVCSTGCASRGRSCPAPSRSFIRDGRRAYCRGRAGRLGRRDPPAGDRRVGSERHGGGVRARSRRRARALTERYHEVTGSRTSVRTSRSWWRTT